MSALADRCLPDGAGVACFWLSVAVLLGVPSPDYLQWLNITTESGARQATQSELCRASHILVAMQPLIDPFGRRVTDLRISITDRCNFRCTYCMPAEGMQWLPREELLTYEEQAQIVRVCVERYGFESVRITGGEPTLRAHLPRLVAMLAPLGIDIAMTTNGVKLPEMAHDLADAGLRRINVSLDSLRPDVFLALTRRDDLHRVLAGIDAALDAGLHPVKVNCVVMRGVNDDEVVDLAAYGRERGVGVRFIEFMPLDADGTWSSDQVVPAAEILERINAVFPLAAGPSPGRGTSSPPSASRTPTASATSG